MQMLGWGLGFSVSGLGGWGLVSRFPSDALEIRVHFFLICRVNKETTKCKGKNGTTGVPRLSVPD